MKRMLRAAAILACLLLFFCISAAAETISGTCGTGVSWNLDTETGAMVISGNGGMAVDAYATNVTGVPWWDYRALVKTIVVEEGVTKIDDYAFWGCTNLQSISIPASVTSIGPSTCANAESITIAEENETFSVVDNVLFRKATVTENGVAQEVLSELVQYPKKKQGAYVIPETVTKLSTRAFASCSGLTSITIPDTISAIPYHTFVDCGSLAEVHLGNGVTTIDTEAFRSCKSLQRMDMPNVKTIGYQAFLWCSSLEEVIFSEHLVSISNGAFSSCPIREITFYEGLLSIGSGAFGTLKSANRVFIPSTVTSIGKQAFTHAEGVEVSPLNPNYSSVDGVLFNKDKTILLQYPCARTDTSYYVPQGVTTVETYAFGRTTELATIYFPDTLTTIKANLFSSYLSGGPTPIKKTAYFYGDAPEYTSTGNNLYFSQIYYQYGMSGWTTPTWNNINAEPFEEMSPDVMPDTIFYDANGGTGAPTEQVKSAGGGIILSGAVPTRQGYTFLGWAYTSTATEPKYQPSDYYEGFGDIVLYAVWKANTYTVTYDANGGTNAPETQNKEHGTTLALLEQVPTRTHYRFLGWATYATAQTVIYEPGASFTTNEDTTLYAVWEAITYTVTYDTNGGNDAPTAQTKRAGETLTLTSAIPAKLGYTFLGWAIAADSKEVDYTAGGSYEANADVILYAVWERTVSADAPVVTLSGAEATPGGTVKLTASISNNTGLAGFRFYIKADTSVFSVGETDGELDITQGDFTSNGQLMSNIAEGGWQVMWYHTSNITRNGTLFSVTFRVSETAADGKYPIELICSAEDTITADGTLVPLAADGSTITISSCTPGDVNGDGKVTNADVIRLARSVIGLETLSDTQRSAADVTGDGKVTNADVIRLARFVIGLDSL